MHRPRSGSVLVVVALAMAAVLPIFAAPAGAVTTSCSSGQYPNREASQSGLKVACTDINTDVANHIDIHDSDNAIWHHGSSALVALGTSPYGTVAQKGVNSASNVLHLTVAATITAADIRRPVSVISGTSHLLKGGAFITAVAGLNVTISQPACTTTGTLNCSPATALTVRVEHTNNRWLVNATCAAGGVTVTTTAPGFAPTDLGKSVSGGPFAAGTYIDVAPVAGALVAHTNQVHTDACTTNNNGDSTASPPIAPIVGADQVEIGAGQYNTGTGLPVWNTLDAMTLELSNTTGGGLGFTCAAGNTLGMTLGSKTDTGGFVAADVGLATSLRKSASGVVTVVPGKITAVNLAGNTTATLGAAQCPALAAVSALVSQAMIVGLPDANAPANNDAMMTLGAELNLSPALVATGDNCDANTIEGFMVVGGWVNPGATYAGNTSTPEASVAQILFPTSVISFNGYVVPKKGGETNGAYSDANPHYTFTFPLLPTSLAECIDKNGTVSTADDHPLDATGLTFAMNPATMAKAPFLPTGSGNIGDPSVRTLVALTTPFDVTTQLINNTSGVISTDATTCTPVSLTTDPGFTCGDG